MGKKILWLSDSVTTTTGYSTMSLHILNGLVKNGWEVDMLAHNYIGQTLPRLELMDGTTANFNIHGCGKAPYCQDIIMPKIQELKPDAFFILLDTFMTFPWLMNLNFSPAYSGFYSPSDGGCGMPLGCENILRKVNLPIAMSKFCQKQVKDYYNIDMEYIPHAVDTKLFYPLSKEEKEKAKAEFGVHGKFVVGCVSRNQGRKMMDRILKIFDIFRKKYKDTPDAVLLLHTDPMDAAAVFSLFDLIKLLDLENRIVFTGLNFTNTFKYEKLNRVYNAMDVFLLPTSGEGFGIPIIEAMACGVPPIVTDYTTTPELLKEDGICGRPIKLTSCKSIDMWDLMFNKKMNMKEIDKLQLPGTITGNWNVERGICDLEDGADAIYEYYNNRDLLQQHAKTGEEKVKKFYTWEVVNKQWDEILTKLINR